jgi:dihydroorotate dehydrogenase (fumarate)
MDLSTRYLGLTLRTPLVAAASPLSRTVGGVRELADAGVGAVVLYSLFEEQLRRESERNARLVAQGSETYAESLTYFPVAVERDYGANRYLRLLESAADTVDVPIIGSLNGITPGGWVRYARSMQDAGAAAIEVNIYYLPGDPHIDGRDVEQRHLDVVDRVKSAVNVPVAVKISPFFSSIAEMAQRLDDAGADGLVLFNRVLQPDIDCETVTTAPGVHLSSADEIRLPLTWIALLHKRLRASLAASTGVESATEVIKYLLAGADVVQSASALLRHGPQHAGVLLHGLREWMRRKGYTTLDEVRGKLAVREDGSARERRDYVSALRDANSGAYVSW